MGPIAARIITHPVKIDCVVAGSAAMVAGQALPASGASQLALLLSALAAPALLVALEASAGGRKTAAPAARRTETALPAATGHEPVVAYAEEELAEPEASSRRAEEAILHDLKSPLSVLRVYADLISEGARRGELPNPEQRRLALAFYRSVGATRYVREGEPLLAASA